MSTTDNIQMSLLPGGATQSGAFHTESTAYDGSDARSDPGHVRVIGAPPNIQEWLSGSKHFLKLLLMWVGTIIMTSLVLAIVTIYRAKGVITPAQKNTFNFSITVLILVLGLSFFVSLPLVPYGSASNVTK